MAVRSTDRGTLNLTSATPFTFSLTSAIESGTGHLGKSIPAAAGNCRFFVARPLVFAAISFRMRTSEKRRILHYFGANKSLRIRTYKKGGGGWGSLQLSTVDCRLPNSSDRHDLFFFGRAQILDLLGFRVRHLL